MRAYEGSEWEQESEGCYQFSSNVVCADPWVVRSGELYQIHLKNLLGQMPQFVAIKSEDPQLGELGDVCRELIQSTLPKVKLHLKGRVKRGVATRSESEKPKLLYKEVPGEGSVPG